MIVLKEFVSAVLVVVAIIVGSTQNGIHFLGVLAYIVNAGKVEYFRLLEFSQLIAIELDGLFGRDRLRFLPLKVTAIVVGGVGVAAVGSAVVLHTRLEFFGQFLLNLLLLEILGRPRFGFGYLGSIQAINIIIIIIIGQMMKIVYVVIAVADDLMMMMIVVVIVIDVVVQIVVAIVAVVFA